MTTLDRFSKERQIFGDILQVVLDTFRVSPDFNRHGPGHGISDLGGNHRPYRTNLCSQFDSEHRHEPDMGRIFGPCGPLGRRRARLPYGARYGGSSAAGARNRFGYSRCKSGTAISDSLRGRDLFADPWSLPAIRADSPSAVALRQILR